MTDTTDKCPWCGHEVTRAKFEEITKKIRAEEQRKLETSKAEVEAHYEKLYRDQLDAARTNATKAAEDQAAAKSAAELEEQRLILDAAHAKTLATERTKHSAELDKVKKEIEELHRKLKTETPNQIGEGGEIDLFDALREEFTGYEDKFTRVKKGQEGADIHHEVIHKGAKCGLIIFDAKYRQAWQRRFASKLREDQVAEQADYAVLATTVFPSGKKELCHEEEVILVSPPRAIHLARVLRDALVKMHVRGLSQKEREGKVEELYQYIISEDYAQKFAEA